MLPSLSELLNPSYLLLLGIVILSIAVLYLYFENKMREQNHKISSMLSLVSSLAEEMNANRANTTNARQPLHVGTHMFYPKKLTVSDDEDEDEDEEEDDDGEDSVDNSEIESLNDDDNNEDEEEDDDSDDDSDNNDNLYTDDTIHMHMIEIGDNSNIKILKLNTINMNASNQQTHQEFDLDNIDNIEEGSDDLSFDDNIESLDDDSEDDVEHQKDDDENTKTNSSIINLDDLKSIDISNLETPTAVEYKKLSVAKLRSIAQEKGLIDDASKLKKPELIELLEK